MIDEIRVKSVLRELRIEERERWQVKMGEKTQFPHDSFAENRH